jgi:predicted PurR-regulated permease PerM
MTKIDENYFIKIMTAIILVFLIVLSFLLLKPILLSVILGILLAFVFTPIYEKIYKFTKSKNLSAALIIVVLFLIIFIPLWFLTPILIEQSFKIIQATIQVDFITPLKNLFPNFFSSAQLNAQISSTLGTFTTKIADSITDSLTNILLNFPTISLQILVVLFTFFFVLRDQQGFSDYIKSLLPFSKEVENRLFQYSSDITRSVLYGQVIIGIVQGVIAGIGFIIFGVPNAIFLALIATLAGIFPIIGTAIIWVPVAIYMLLAGDNVAGWGVAIFGILSSTIDNFLRPIFVSRMTKLHSAVVLISMIGGLFLFGILGFILGPLIIAYLLIILELYRKKPLSGLIIHDEKKK